MKKIALALLLLLAGKVWAQSKDQDHMQILMTEKVPVDRSSQVSFRHQISAPQRKHPGNFISRWADKIERKANKWSSKLERKLNKAFH